MDLFASAPDPVEWNAVQPRLTWIRAAHPVNVAVVVLDAFPPPGPADHSRRRTSELAQWLLGVRTHWSFYYRIDTELAEALQLLEHSELIVASFDDAPWWTITRFGLAVRTEGHDAVRRRIQERTGFTSTPRTIEDAAPE